jgi:hypothetical protein
MPPPKLEAFRPFRRAFGASLSSAYFLSWLGFVLIFMLGCYIINALLADEAVSYTKTFLGSPALEKHLVAWLKTAIQYPIAVSIGLACVGIIGAAVFSAIRVETNKEFQPLPTGTDPSNFSQDDRPANLICSGWGTRQITLGQNDNWMHANFWFEESVSVALIVSISNLAKPDRRVGKANSVWARITYVTEDEDVANSEHQRGFAADPGTWLERTPTFSLNVGENAELIIALATDVADQNTGTMIPTFRAIEDHRLKHSDKTHPYLFGPIFLRNIVARVTLTANEMEVGRYKFLLQLGPPPTIRLLPKPETGKTFLSRLGIKSD